MFGLWLVLMLLILLVVIWLFICYCNVCYWLFVYGFGLFVLSVFFIELVLYLLNFGGYVWVLVGIVFMVFVGFYMMKVF